MEKIELILYNFELKCYYGRYQSNEVFRFTCNKDQVIKRMKEYIPLPGSMTCILPKSYTFTMADLWMDYGWKNDRVAGIRYKKKDKEFKVLFNKKFNSLPRTNNKSY